MECKEGAHRENAAPLSLNRYLLYLKEEERVIKRIVGVCTTLKSVQT